MRLKYYNSMIQPHIDYCLAIYGNAGKEQLKKIHRIQKQFGRAILDIKNPQGLHIIHMFKELDWLPIDERAKYFKCVQTYKILHGDCPSYLSSHVKQVSAVHGDRSTRQLSDNLLPPKYGFNSGLRTFKYSSSVLWNSLPVNVRKANSAEIFKDAYLSHIKSTVYNGQHLSLDQ